MSRMSEQHDDLSTIHAILLGQRQVAKVNNQKVINNEGPFASEYWSAVVECIDNLLLEIEAAGVVWPDNVVELSCGNTHPKRRPWVDTGMFEEEEGDQDG